MKRRTVIIALILLTSGIWAGAWGQTADGAAFLKIGMGVRALGMGGAFVAVADEAAAGYWNPAGLDLYHRMGLEASYSRLSLDRQYYTGAFSQPLGRFGSLGLGWIRFGVDNIELREGDSPSPDGYGRDEENAYLVSVSKSVFGALSLGITGKYITQDLLGKHATATGADLGALLRMTNGWSLRTSARTWSGREDRRTHWPGWSKRVSPTRLRKGGFSSPATGSAATRRRRRSGSAWRGNLCAYGASGQDTDKGRFPWGPGWPRTCPGPERGWTMPSGRTVWSKLQPTESL